MRKVLAEVAQERAYQDKKWGHQVDDTKNTPWMWVSYISAYSCKWMVGSFAPLGTPTTDAFRTAMIKTAAICVAAVESIDRQRKKKGIAFYE
jgi:hypothetical protein